MKNLFPVLSLLLCAALAGPAHCADPLKKLSEKLGKGVEGRENKKVAVLGFPYPDGASSSGSTIVQERLTTFLVEGGSLEVIERNLIKKILEEKKLEQTGIIDPATTRELGRVLGVGAVVTGTLNDLPKGMTEVNARIIDSETGRILAAAQAEVERTWKDPPVKAGSAAPTPPGPGPSRGKSLVQLAILLDTSNSMDGLINQARTQIWKIVNELSGSEKGGAGPDLQVALYEYGNDSLKADEGHIRLVLPFTSDLDHLSEKLFSLKTNGGQEYCGWVLREAVRNLQWDARDDVYKAVFIAGNEPFTQGPVDFRASAAEAAKKGVFVNTIFCGSRQEGVATQWKAGAELGNGDFSNIDQNVQVAAVSAPQDAEIERLGRELNATFIPYGAKGMEGQKKQMEMDAAMAAPAAAAQGAATQRAMFKASSQYNSSASWDLVEALGSGRVREDDLKKEELPADLRAMKTEERAAFVRKQADERKRIQARIQELGSERARFVAEKEKQAASQGSRTLDAAVIGSVRSQAAKKGFQFKAR
jgi:TolB-like protein